MTIHLQREIQSLNRSLLGLGALVEDSLFRAIRAVVSRDAVLAASVVEIDSTIDRTEVEVEEECLKLLALHQPVAGDLRFIVAVLKINNDLERIGDLAQNIAKRALRLSQLPEVRSPFDYQGMAEQVKSMLRNALQALVTVDTALARGVLAADDDVDRINKEMYRVVQESIRKQPEYLENFIFFLSVSRNLERIADHATNIAEDVIYMVEGQIVRHGLGRPEIEQVD
jgi:phosphate transport system protein